MGTETTSVSIMENTFYAALVPTFEKIISENNCPEGYISFNELSAYSTVMFGSDLLFRICMRGKSSYFSIPNKYKYYFPDCKFYTTKVDEKAGFCRADITSFDAVKLSDSFGALLEKVIYSQPKEMDICDLYEQCSLEKRCVIKNKELSLHCGYKKILKSGRIFYGPNRNID